jgi:hypothetical protein
MTTVFHENNFVTAKLNYFIQIRKIPNIVFHGSSGCGKRTIVGDFINRIYDGDRNRIKTNVMFVNCAHGKGIKFIRDELKYFAKANIQCNDKTLFKSIVLYNADELTIDAQSALRRCIELFSHNTRFFIVVENKHKLLKPILSRFCEIFVPDKTENPDNPVYKSLHKVNRDAIYGFTDLKRECRNRILEPALKDVSLRKDDYKWFMNLANQLYEDGISCLDIIQYLEEVLDKDKMVQVQFCFEKVKGEFRSEKLLMMYLFDYVFLRSDCNLKNVSFL